MSSNILIQSNSMILKVNSLNTLHTHYHTSRTFSHGQIHHHQNDITFDMIRRRITIGELFRFICESEGRGKGGSLEK